MDGKGVASRRVTNYLSHGCSAHASEGHRKKRLSIAHRQDCLNAQLDRLCESTAQFLGDDWNDDNTDQLSLTAEIDEDDGEDIFNDSVHLHHSSHPDGLILPLPSYLATEQANNLGLATLVDQEPMLREGQANDALHELRVALASKVVIFWTDVRHAGTYNMTTRAWGRVASADVKVQQQAAIYHRCCKQMVSLNAGGEVLDQYKVLKGKT